MESIQNAHIDDQSTNDFVQNNRFEFDQRSEEIDHPKLEVVGSDNTIMEPQKNDILFGRHFQNRQAKVALRLRIAQRHKEHSIANTEMRIAIVNEIVTDVAREGGRFLEARLLGQNGEAVWVEAPPERARAMVSSHFHSITMRLRQLTRVHQEPA